MESATLQFDSVDVDRVEERGHAFDDRAQTQLLHCLAAVMGVDAPPQPEAPAPIDRPPDDELAPDRGLVLRSRTTWSTSASRSRS